MTPGRVVVLGVGNPWRRDDGAGPAVARAVARRDRSIDARELDGEATRLVEAWDGAEVAVVVDAVRTGGAPPGTVREVDPSKVESATSASSHGLGVQEAIGLSRALGRAPARLVLVGIEGGDFGMGPDLSAPVAAAVDQAADLVLAIVGRNPLA